MKTSICIAAGGVLHTLVVFAPWLASAGHWRLALDPRFWTLLVLVNLFYAAELGAMQYAAHRTLGALRDADRRLHRLSLASCAAVVLIFWTAQWQAHFAQPSWWRLFTGAALMAAGILLRAGAIGQLGRQFIAEATRPGGGDLVQDGLYAWMRHPSETGVLLIAAGASVLMGSPLAGLLCAVLLLPLIGVRIRLEERALRDAYGDEFNRYQARVPALAPFRF